MPLTLPEARIDEMVAHARQTAPEECCGILLGNGDVVRRSRRVENVHDERSRRYTMDPLEIIEADREAQERGEEFVAFYHSHPGSQAYPSETDIDNAVESEWIEPYYVLVSLADETRPVVRAFRISADRRVEEVVIDSDEEPPDAASDE